METFARGFNRIRQLMRAGGTAGLSDVLVEVIDTAVVDKVAFGIKDCGFRSGLGHGFFYESVIQIANRRQLVIVVPKITANFIGRFVFVRKNEAERGLLPVLFVHLLQQWCVAI